MEQMEMSMKIEAEAAVTSPALSNSEIDLNFFKQDPGLLQSVKSEPSFNNDPLLKEEILVVSSQDGSEQKRVHAASTSARTGCVNEICSTSLGDLLNVKYESVEMDIGPTVLQHMDSHYTLHKLNMSATSEENTVVVDCNEAMPGSGVKKENIEGEMRDIKATSHNCNQTTLVDYNEAHMNSHNICDTRVENSSGLNTHVRTHKGEKPFQCNTCDRRFPQKRNLILHIRIHTGEKPYQCKMCKARFTQSSTLTKHMRVHTGEKRYQCKICKARFTENSNLTKHLIVHMGDKPYQCNLCDARFIQNCNLTRHMRVHTDK